MGVGHWLGAAAIAGLIAGCAMAPADTGPAAKTALAPTGKLRAAILLAAVYAAKDPATGELKGVAVDLGQDLARRIGVPFEPVVYAGVPALMAGAKAGEWDIAFTGINPERAAVMDFSPAYMEIEQGYLVRGGVPIASVEEVDRTGIRVGVLQKGGADAVLSATLKNATIVRAGSVPDLFALLTAGKADAVAIGKPGLYTEAPKHPGSRVLDGRFLVEPIGIAVPKGRDAAAAATVGRFVEQAKAQGVVSSAIQRAGIRGVVVASSR